MGINKVKKHGDFIVEHYLPLSFCSGTDYFMYCSTTSFIHRSSLIGGETG